MTRFPYAKKNLVSGDETTFVHWSALVVTIILLPSLAVAQPATGKEDADKGGALKETTQSPPAAGEEIAPAGGDAAPESAPSESAPSDAEKEIAALKQRIEKLEQTSEATVQENAALQEHVAMFDETQIQAMEEKRKELKIYGFLDVQWYKFIYSDRSSYNGQLNNKNTFAVGHWNLYVEKQLSDSFRVLGEVRFLFQPYGEEISYGMNLGTTSTVYERANTKATDWVDAYYFDWGGISIQRAFIEYKLNDYFGVLAGNYLTPYGIWNVDHASTVVIPAHRPFISTAQLMPETQTGLYLFGRGFPNSKTSIDYGVTLSNGRGPASKLYDLDENKAMGLNLGFGYDGPIKLGFGTYLFMGEYTNIARNMAMNMETSAFEYSIDTLAKYAEKAMSFFLKFEGGGLLIQGEYARGLIRYKKGGRQFLYTDFTGQDIYLPDFIQQAVYALVAYRLPFDAISITPYFIYEFQDPSDTANLPIGHNYGGGINWRIMPSVVWKVEGLHHQQSEVWMNYTELNYTLVSTQLAVSY